jgi:hypothetical protein
MGGPGRLSYIPAELCDIEPSEPHRDLGKLGPKEPSEMLRVASRKPRLRHHRVRRRPVGQLFCAQATTQDNL